MQTGTQQQQQLEEIPPEEIPAENVAPFLYVATDLFAAECVQRLGLHPMSSTKGDRDRGGPKGDGGR